MKRTVVALSLMGLMVLPAFGQDKEADRVMAAGTVISEIMNVPDDIPQSVIDKADCVRVVDSTRKKDLYSWNKGEPSISFGEHRSPPYEPVEAVFIVDSPEECASVKALVVRIKGNE